MARPNIKVSTRDAVGKGPNRRLRAAGGIPGVVYGTGKAPVAVAADPKEVVAVLNGNLGRNAAIDLEVEGEGGSRLAIIKDYQVHPWKRRIEHVDFWEIQPGQILTVTVPFKRKGRAEAERQGGKIRVTRDDVVVQCNAANVPALIEFDLTGMPAQDANIHISEIPLPEGVTAVFKHDYSLVQITMPRVSAAEAEAAAAPVKAKAKAKK